ncbi:MAG: glycosyltransferase [Candidatus Brocadiaceae bacterium]|uniref:TIGR04282 family arsenosugar biosynthesis glycosyltransferase n=1 Tax=Candidatus Wunengus sp. YC61 TaxID=3367698 RepID=UPI002723A54F|nr:glycosyltransferase [Candidatus Brocadiaceae bacterium]
MENALIVFIKYPEPGKVKTRLAKDIGNEKACAIYKLLAEGVIKNVAQKNLKTYDVHIFFTPADKEMEIKDWLKPILNDNRGVKTRFSPQEGRNLGERMSNAFRQIVQEKGYKKCITQRTTTESPLKNWDEGGCKKKSQEKMFLHNTIIIGTDCPEIDTTLIENAFGVLKEKDIVIGPCTDGGYYLLGMSRFVPDLFVAIDWSTDRVFKQTMEKVRKNNVSCGILKTLTDIDTQEDLSCHTTFLGISL